MEFSLEFEFGKLFIGINLEFMVYFTIFFKKLNWIFIWTYGDCFLFHWNTNYACCWNKSWSYYTRPIHIEIRIVTTKKKSIMLPFERCYVIIIMSIMPAVWINPGFMTTCLRSFEYITHKFSLTSFLIQIYQHSLRSNSSKVNLQICIFCLDYYLLLVL